MTGVWSSLNTGDTTGFGDIGTYYGGLASQLPEINSLLADPWYVFGQDFNAVVDDLFGQNGGEFGDLFSNVDNVDGAGDLMVMFESGSAALDSSFADVFSGL
jgi:hypothetical protein